MLARLAAAASILLAVSCTPVPPVDTAVIGPYGFGSNQDVDTTAVNLSAWAFADPARTRDDPADAARAVAGVDYLAGALFSNPRWSQVSPLIKQQMRDARIEVRHALGIAPGARSQDVVDGMLRAASAMQAGDQRAAQAALSGPVFTLGAAETYTRLVALPFLTMANVATQRMNGSLNGRGNESCPGCG